MVRKRRRILRLIQRRAVVGTRAVQCGRHLPALAGTRSNPTALCQMLAETAAREDGVLVVAVSVETACLRWLRWPCCTDCWR